VRRGPNAFCTGSTVCTRHIDRFIWDGDQILAEVSNTVNWKGLFDSGTDLIGRRQGTEIDWAATYRGSYADIDPDQA
jgi:hypothetical protein